MDEEELQAKLLQHNQQLQSVNKLLQKDPDNETLLKLKDDMKQVIILTEKFLETKAKKSKSARDSAAASAAAAASSSSADVDGATHAPAVQESLLVKKVPREWGMHKSEWSVGERCQVLFTDNKWYIAEITELDDPGEATMVLLDSGASHTCKTGELRTYVPPLHEEVKEGQEVRACWPEDGHFYDAKVDKVNPDGTFDVTYTKYDEKATINISEIQLKRVKKRKRDEDYLLDESGKVAEKFVAPDYLKPQDDDHPDARRRKKKKLKLLKSKHKELLGNQQQAAQQSSWQKFHNSKKSKRSKFDRNRESLFKSKKDGKIGVSNQTSGTMTSYTKHQKYHHLRMDPNAGI